MENVVPKEFLIQVGAKIAYYRRINHLSQKELAERIHVTPSVVSRIERGNYNEDLSFSVLFAIGQALHVNASLFVTFTEYEKELWTQ